MNVLMNKTPCYGCKDRFCDGKTNCHSTCEKYKAFYEKNEEYKKTKQKNWEYSQFYYDITNHIRDKGFKRNEYYHRQARGVGVRTVK